MNAILCRQFKGVGSYKPPLKKDTPFVDPISVELCLNCPLPVEQCNGAPSVHTGVQKQPTRCAYEQAIAARKRKPRTVALPGPRPDGVMRTWECEVG